MEKNDKDYAVVVGINHYKPPGSLRSLKHAVDDANEFYNWLVHDEHGGRLPESNCIKLESKEKSGKPVQDEIDDAFELLFNQIGDSQGRRFYFYFSGHGLSPGALQAFLCLPKWSRRRPSEALDSASYQEVLGNVGLFEEIACFFDCCRSFKPNVSAKPSALAGARPDENNAAKSRLYFAFAAEHTKEAFEAREEDGQGFFTQALLSGLRGGACQVDGGATATALKTYVESQTKILAKQAGVKQTPAIYNGLSDANESVFGSALPLDRLSYNISIEGGPNRPVFLIHPDNSETRWDKTNPWKVSLPEGLHLLEDKDSGKVMRLTRVLETGEEEIDVKF